jgi:ABC-2 type transport system permease protein
VSAAATSTVRSAGGNGGSGGARGALGRLRALGVKELLQLRRDRLTLAMMVALPAVQLLLFGFAIDTDVRHVPAVVLDQDHSTGSRDFVVRLQSTGFYDVRGEVRSYAEIGRALRAGEAKAALIFPPRWGADAASGRAAALQLVIDGTDPQTVASALDTATGLAFARTSDLLVERLGRAGLPVPVSPISVEPVTWYNPDLKTSTFVVPGLVGVILTMTMVMLTAMAVARERERGTLEQLIVSPLKPAELIIGKLVPYVGIGYVQMTLVLLLGKLVFGVPFVGSVGLLYVVAALFIAANLALGLVFSTIARTQQQAMQMSFFFILPNILLSGFAFPWEGMPRVAQWLSLALPLTHFLRIVRGVVLKGSSVHDFGGELVWLAAILTVLVLLASLRFNKKLG